MEYTWDVIVNQTYESCAYKKRNKLNEHFRRYLKKSYTEWREKHTIIRIWEKLNPIRRIAI
jgi:hypothetical protein